MKELSLQFAVYHMLNMPFINKKERREHLNSEYTELCSPLYCCIAEAFSYHKIKLQVIEIKLLKKVMGVMKLDKIRYSTMRAELEV